jgi:acetyl-CoA synthetase (ADP-forming)
MNYLRQKNVPVFDDFLKGASCLEALFGYAKAKSVNAEKEKPVLSGDIKNRIAVLTDKAVREKRNFLLAGETRELLETTGIEQPAGAVVPNAEAAVHAAVKTGYPVVMKVVSPDILHKSDSGGVLLNLKNEKQIKDGFSRIRENCLNCNPKARFQGVEISSMLKPGLEIIVGARRDASFGPIVMCGFGGIYVEVLKDIVFRSFPITREEGRRMLKELKAYPLLAGARGAEPLDVEAVVDTILKAGELITMCPEIADIELNPVFVYPKGLKAVDARVILSGHNP